MVCPDCRESPTKLCANHHIQGDNLTESPDPCRPRGVSSHRQTPRLVAGNGPPCAQNAADMAR